MLKRFIPFLAAFIAFPAIAESLDLEAIKACAIANQGYFPATKIEIVGKAEDYVLIKMHENQGYWEMILKMEPECRMVAADYEGYSAIYGYYHPKGEVPKDIAEELEKQSGLVRFQR